MLQAQVNFWTLQETKRHNLTAEELEARNLDIQQFNAMENQRHNQMYEVIQISGINETRRHNVQTEKLGFDSLAETQRHNVVTEEIGKQQNAISAQNAYTNWYNAETGRYSAEQQSGIGWMNAGSQRTQAQASAKQAETARLQQHETARHNRNQELIGVAGELNKTLGTVLDTTLGYGNLANSMKRTSIDAASEARKASEAFWNSNW